VVLGLFLLLVPGFLFSAVLYPKPTLDAWTRAGMSLGLGIMLLLYVGYFLAKPELRLLDAYPFVLSVLGICAVLGVIAYFRGGLQLFAPHLRRLGSAVSVRRRKKLEGPAPESGKPAEESAPPAAGG